ncbi:hypothetical protein YC2023_018368 [Brassica napus]
MENSHLKTAQDQVPKGGYSIILKPEDSSSAAWFITRTVLFLSNPDVVERVYTMGTEITNMT